MEQRSVNAIRNPTGACFGIPRDFPENEACLWNFGFSDQSFHPNDPYSPHGITLDAENCLAERELHPILPSDVTVPMVTPLLSFRAPTESEIRSHFPPVTSMGSSQDPFQLTSSDSLMDLCSPPPLGNRHVPPCVLCKKVCSTVLLFLDHMEFHYQV